MEKKLDPKSSIRILALQGLTMLYSQLDWGEVPIFLNTRRGSQKNPTVSPEFQSVKTQYKIPTKRRKSAFFALQIVVFRST
ncbi:hypothetical protein GCM10027454_05520 [Algoriphagus aestuariicola]|jgi:hypothetical protein